MLIMMLMLMLMLVTQHRFKTSCFRCWYCLNRSLISGHYSPDSVTVFLFVQITIRTAGFSIPPYCCYILLDQHAYYYNSTRSPINRTPIQRDTNYGSDKLCNLWKIDAVNQLCRIELMRWNIFKELQAWKMTNCIYAGVVQAYESNYENWWRIAEKAAAFRGRLPYADCPRLICDFLNIDGGLASFLWKVERKTAKTSW